MSKNETPVLYELFEKVQKPNYCIDRIGDCCTCPVANENTDCMNRNKRFTLKKGRMN